MSMWEDYDEGDERQNEVACKYCGGHFEWAELNDGRFVLITPGGMEHRCRKMLASRSADADEFPTT